MSEQKKGLPSLGRYFGAVWITLAVVSVAVLNSWAGEDTAPANTISAWATLWGSRTVAVPFFYGAVGGHWSSRQWKSWRMPGGPLPLLTIVAELGLADYFTSSGLANAPASFAIFMALGALCGALLWPMHDKEVG